MDHTTRTIIFGVAAALAISMAFATGIWNAPKDPDQFSDEGTEFYPEFVDPAEARSIKVVVYNEETDAPEEFEVKYQDGVWRIPSHNNYPADGEEQLAKTATSVIGIKRDSLQSESRDDHEELGVIDPSNSELTSGKGCGTHVILRGENDKELVDYIIGREFEPGQGRYFIRRADEDRTYLAKLEIDVSTKFVDWIEPNLLDVERNDIVELVIDNYTVEETRTDEGYQFEAQRNDFSILTRESGGFQWDLEGLDAETESLNTGVVNAMLTALDDLKIVGVRPKPEILQSIIRGEPVPDTPLASLALSDMQFDMRGRGFYMSSSGLLSNEGALVVGTDEGVSYQLLVGNVFVGSQTEIEIGGDKSEADESTSEESATDPASTDAESVTDAELAPGEQRSRYLFILTTFDEKLLGPRPEPPVMPTPPILPGEGDDASTEAEETTEPEASDSSATEAEAVESETEEAPQCDDPATETDAAASTDDPVVTDDADSEETAADDAAESDTASGDDTAAESESNEADTAAATDDAADEEAPAVPTAEELQAAYEAALQDYDAALIQYEADVADYDERLAAGQKKVEELRERFAQWYYVIPADVFEDLDISRADLVGPKTADPATGAAPDFNLPGFPGQPGELPDLSELLTPDATEGADAEGTTPMPEETNSDASDAEGTETPDETTTEAENAGETEAAAATTETPEEDGSQSGESDDSPAAETDSEAETSTMP